MPTSAIPKRYTIVIFVVVTLIVAFLVKTQAKTELTLHTKALTRVQVAAVQSQLIAVTQRATGRLQPARKANLHFQVAGQVQERLVEPGQTVIQNQLLLTLQRHDASDNLTEAKTQWRLEHARIQNDKALLVHAVAHGQLQAQEFERLKRLKKNAMASSTAVDEAEQKLLNRKKDMTLLQHKVDTASQRLALKQAVVSRAQRAFERTHLQAPYDGVVNVVRVGVGDFVTLQNAVLEIVDVSALDLLVEIEHRIVGQLSIGQPVQVSCAGATVPGAIFSIQRNARQDTHTHPLKVRVQDPSCVLDAVVSAELLLWQRHMLVLPPVAILHAYGNHFVYRYVDGLAQLVPVVLGVHQGQWQEVVSGLQVGDQVILGNLERLSDQQRVEVLPVLASAEKPQS